MLINGKSKYDWIVFTFRCSEFEVKLEGYSKELEGFRKREVMTTEEMKNNVEKLNELSTEVKGPVGSVITNSKDCNPWPGRDGHGGC